MAKKGGSNRMKRLSAPRQWDIGRKEERFVWKPSPGPYGIAYSYPLGFVIRDILGLVKNAREVTHVLTSGEVFVDGKVRRSPSFPVGLFNVVEVPKEKQAYRFIPSPDGLVVTKVTGEETRLKLCSIRRKLKAKGGVIQYGLHDGRSLLSDSLNLSLGDTVVLKMPEQSIVVSFKLAKGSLGLVISGERAGQLGKITDVKKGSITRERMVEISLPGGETELPSRLVLPVGTDKPVIGVTANK
jgi:small subunit ribosomal protein S4e